MWGWNTRGTRCTLTHILLHQQSQLLLAEGRAGALLAWNRWSIILSFSISLDMKQWSLVGMSKTLQLLVLNSVKLCLKRLHQEGPELWLTGNRLDSIIISAVVFSVENKENLIMFLKNKIPWQDLSLLCHFPKVNIRETKPLSCNSPADREKY